MADLDHDGTLTYYELYKFIVEGEGKKYREHLQDVGIAFLDADSDKDGELSRKEQEQMVKEMEAEEEARYDGTLIGGRWMDDQRGDLIEEKFYENNMNHQIVLFNIIQKNPQLSNGVGWWWWCVRPLDGIFRF